MNENFESAEANHGFQYGDFVGDITYSSASPIIGPDYVYASETFGHDLWHNNCLFIKFIKIHENAKLPILSSEEAACSDLYSVEDILIPSGKTVLVPTGLQVAFIPKGYKIEIYCRSGMASKGMHIGNGVGQVDSDYRGEIKVIIFNSTDKDFSIKVGDRIAQIALEKVNPVKYEFVKAITETKRGSGGFGSTGS